MIKVTKWRPDTCQCAVEYAWDSDLEIEDREHTLHSIAQCGAHSELTPEEAYSIVCQENVLKNQVMSEIMANAPELVKTVVDDAGNQSLDFIDSKRPEFSYDEDRNLIISIKDSKVSDNIKTVLESKYDEIKVDSG